MNVKPERFKSWPPYPCTATICISFYLQNNKQTRAEAKKCVSMSDECEKSPTGDDPS